MEQQNQNVQVEEGLSLMGIIKILMAKLKILILVAIIGAIAGGAFAVWRTVDINYFGTRVEFYVNPERPEESAGETGTAGAGGSQYGVYGAYGRHVMDNMVKLLSSDSFAEQLLLNGADLPAKHSAETQWFSENAYKTVNGENKFLGDLLNEAIDAAQTPLANLAVAKENLDKALATRTTKMAEYTKAEDLLNVAWREQLFNNGLVLKASFNTEEYFSEELKTKVDSRQDAKEYYEKVKTAYGTYVSTQNDVTTAMMSVNNLEAIWKAERKIANEAVEVALEYWRESPVYVAQLIFFKNSISYSYLNSNETASDANNLARSFIYVGISICDGNPQNGIATADMLLQRVKKVVPAYVETNMTVPDGYSGTNCQRITRTDGISLINPNYTTMQAIKYALVFGVAATVVAAVLILFLDGADQRLRDTDVITRKFNVPLLGIVPTIDELKAEQLAKKVEETVRRKKKKVEATARRRQEKADMLTQKRLERKNKEAKK